MTDRLTFLLAALVWAVVAGVSWVLGLASLLLFGALYCMASMRDWREGFR